VALLIQALFSPTAISTWGPTSSPWGAGSFAGWLLFRLRKAGASLAVAVPRRTLPVGHLLVTSMALAAGIRDAPFLPRSADNPRLHPDPTPPWYP
jgi:hypothetical protein